MADVRVVLADDHAIFRAGLKALLDAEMGILVIGEASTGDEAVELVRELTPDVVIMDLSMAGSSGLEATRRITALGLPARVLVLTMHVEQEYLVPALEAGAHGYVSKTNADQRLIEAIRVVARGEVYLPPRAARTPVGEHRETGESEGALRQLSAREREVLALTAEGFSSKEIGEKLLISPKTVDTYRARIMEKLEINHRSELVRFALRSGLLRQM